MPANTNPIFSVAPDVQSAGALIRSVASVLYDGSGTIGTDIYKVFQADATNGGFVQRIRFRYSANAATASNACVLKIYVSSQSSGATTDANTWLIDEITVPAITPSTTVAMSNFEVPINFPLPPNYTILVKITVAQPANCGFIGVGIGGKY
jgi:hypothetical protein